MLEQIKAFLTALRPNRGPSLEYWQAQLAHNDARSRWEAIDALGQHVNVPRAREALITALGDPHPFVRWQAGEVLSRSRDERTFSLLEAVLASRVSRQRSAAADALGKLGDRRATSALCQALGSRSTEVRRSAAEALARLGDAAALPALAKALRDNDPLVRRAAVSALGAIRDSEAMPALLAMLRDESALVRASAARALGSIGFPVGDDSLRQTLQDPDVGVRWQVIHSLSAVGDSDDATALAACLDDHTEVFGQSIAEAAHQALEAIKHRQQGQEQAPRPKRS
jgi:hypothetical protein